MAVAEGHEVAVGVEVGIELSLGGEATGSTDLGKDVMPGTSVGVAARVGESNGATGCVGVVVSRDKAIQLMVTTGNGAKSSATKYRSWPMSQLFSRELIA
jgi:hypothetical protein